MSIEFLHNFRIKWTKAGLTRLSDVLEDILAVLQIEFHAELPAKVRLLINALSLEFSREITLIDKDRDEGDHSASDANAKRFLQHGGQEHSFLDDCLFDIVDLVARVLGWVV